METKTDALLTRCIILSEIARNAKTKAERNGALDRLSQTLVLLRQPRFDVQKLKKAFNAAVVEKPDYEDPVVQDGNVLHLRGGFDTRVLAFNYFKDEGKTIEVKANAGFQTEGREVHSKRRGEPTEDDPGS
jgi:hypothetical protein